MIYGLGFTINRCLISNLKSHVLRLTSHVTLFQNAGEEPDVPAAVIRDAVAVAVAGEHHVAGVHDGGATVVGNFSFALQNVVNLRILNVRMLLDPASGRQGDDVEHRSALKHLRWREDDLFIDSSLNVTLIFNRFDSNVLFVFYHCCLF